MVLFLIDRQVTFLPSRCLRAATCKW